MNREPSAQEKADVGLFRTQLRELQWQLPLQLQSMLLKVLGGQFDPYSNWNQEHRAIFIHVPRTGGTSMAIALGAPKPHVPISRYAAVDRNRFNAFYKFGFVRNPWDRVLSAFTVLQAAAVGPGWKEGMMWSRAHLSDLPTFEKFVLAFDDPRRRPILKSYHHLRPQIDWLSLPDRKTLAVDFVGRFENISEDFAKATGVMGVNVTLPQVNESKHSPYREAYSRRMQGIIGDLYEEDIRAFGYRF